MFHIQLNSLIIDFLVQLSYLFFNFSTNFGLICFVLYELKRLNYKSNLLIFFSINFDLICFVLYESKNVKLYAKLIQLQKENSNIQTKLKK